jgi:hypothetical protein
LHGNLTEFIQNSVLGKKIKILQNSIDFGWSIILLVLTEIGKIGMKSDFFGQNSNGRMYYDRNYSFRLILLFANTDVSRHILVVDISTLVKSNMDWKEYYSFLLYLSQQLEYFYPVEESKSVETAKVFLRAAGPWFMHACTSRFVWPSLAFFSQNVKALELVCVPRQSQITVRRAT